MYGVEYSTHLSSTGDWVSLPFCQVTFPKGWPRNSQERVASEATVALPNDVVTTSAGTANKDGTYN